MGLIKKLLGILLVCAGSLAAQQPQTGTDPIFAVNAQFVNGVAPGYWSTAGSGLTLNISAGTVFCQGTIRTYAGGTLTMTNSTTNYVYLDTTSNCVPASSTSTFNGSTIPLCVVVTSGGAITSITDDRTTMSTSVGNVGTVPLPINQGGTNTTSTLSGIVRGGSSYTASELSGDATTSGSNAVTLASKFKIRGISFTIGIPGGTALTAGSSTTDYVTVPFACTISAYNLAIDAGTITVKFWKVATGTAIPTSGNSISTSGVSISSGTAIHSTTVSDFTSTAVSANDIIAMNVSTVSGAAYINGVLECDQ